jgi:hypothetical protein
MCVRRFGVTTTETVDQQKAERAKRFGLPIGGAGATAAAATSAGASLAANAKQLLSNKEVVDPEKLKVSVSVCERVIVGPR